MYIYIVSTHGEYGAENVRATCDKSKVAALLSPDNHDLSDEKGILEEVLKLSSRELARESFATGIALSKGWGGFQLHVTELDK